MSREQVLAEEIRSYCRAHADAKQAARYQRYFTEGYDSWGLMGSKDPLWLQQQEEWLAEYHGLGLGGFLKAGEILFASGKYEEGALAIRFVKGFLEEFAEASLPRLAKWFEAGIGNWAHTDVLCGEILAPQLKGGKIKMEALGPWRKSAHKYQRRSVPVAMLGLLKTEKSLGPQLRFLQPMMMDPERVVQQGLGWYLREAWKKQHEPVEKFLLAWKDSAPRLVFQYATEKMPAAERARFRRSKGG